MRRQAGIALVALLAGCSAPASPLPSPSSGPGPSTAPSPSQVAQAPTASPALSGILLGPGGDPEAAAGFSQLAVAGGDYLALGSSESLEHSVLARGSADGATWELLDAARVFNGTLDGMAVGPTGWVAAERIDSPDGSSVGTVMWHSPDSRHWTRLPDQADLSRSYPGLVVAGGWGYAMLGQAVDASGSSFGVVWVSRDGHTWQQMPALDTEIEQVTVTDAGVFAFSFDTAAATSDGRAWVVLDPVPVADAGRVPYARAMGASTFLLADTNPPALFQGDLAGSGLALSISWTAIDPGFNDTVNVSAFATGPLGAMVLGFDRRTLRPIAWASRDGKAWRRNDLDPTAFGGGVPDVVAVGERSFVALGWDVSEAGETRAHAWSSPDGLSWSSVENGSLGRVPELPSGGCPSSDPTSVAELRPLSRAHPSSPRALWPICFGHRELHLEGYVVECEGCGGACGGETGSPAWLLEPCGYARFWLWSKRTTGGPSPDSLAVQVDPAYPVATPRGGAHVRITGHFDDPAATTCRLVVEGVGALQPAGEAIAGCQQQFVVTSVKILLN
jgi:hypothetical protein